jgi:hypothetical protein
LAIVGYQLQVAQLMAFSMQEGIEEVVAVLCQLCFPFQTCHK